MNREQYLTEFARRVAPLFAAVEFPLDLAKIRISVGFPGGRSPKKCIGQCWSQKASADGVNEIFVSPVLGTIQEADHVLVHELCHAAVGLECGHKGAFAKCARAMGLSGKLTSSSASPELRVQLDAISAELGAYPHAGMNLSMTDRKKQSTRMVKIECGDCGYTARTTAKWLEKGLPTCSCGGAFAAPA
jgi:hypothetical protein